MSDVAEPPNDGTFRDRHYKCWVPACGKLWIEFTCDEDASKSCPFCGLPVREMR